MEAYDIPAQALSVSEETIKKSRFITLLAHTDGVEAARAFVQQVKQDHPTARHHCWAWWRARRMIRSSWGFPMTANLRERRGNLCWRS